MPDSPESSDTAWGRRRQGFSEPELSERGFPHRGASEPGFSDPAHSSSRRGISQFSGAAQPGLPGWAAVLLLILIAGVGGLIDEVNGSSIRGWFNWSLIVASFIAILAVKRSQMFGVVIAPPLVYFVASAGMLYLRSGGLKNRKVLIDAAANWLVYGFPAIAGATAIVLLIAGVRMIVRR